MNVLGTEARVGAFVLTALAVLVALVLALGDFSLSSKVRLYADFAYTGGLQTGAPIMVSGVRVGRVVDLRLLAPDIQPPPAVAQAGLGRLATPLVRTTLDVDESVQHLIRQDVRLQVGTQGLIGESYLELTPGSDASAQSAVGESIRGIDAPRLHVMTLQLSALVDAVDGLLGSDQDVDLGGAGVALGNLLGTINDLVGSRKEELGRALGDVAVSAAEVRQILTDVRKALGDGAVVAALLNDSSVTMHTLREELPDILERARASLAAVESLTRKADDAVDAKALAAIVDDARSTSKRLDAVTRDAQSMLQRINRGEGTIGGLMRDPQIYDDLKEMLRDLKKNPWKFLWRD